MLWKLLLDRLTVAKLLAGSVLGGAGNRAVVAPTGFKTLAPRRLAGMVMVA